MISQSVCHCQSFPPQSNICVQGQWPAEWSPIRDSTLANIRIGWKCLTMTNTLAYFCRNLITAVKSLVVKARSKLRDIKLTQKNDPTRGSPYKTFLESNLLKSTNKLECLSLILVFIIFQCQAGLISLRPGREH